MTEVFVAGSLHWDVVVDAPRLPLLDETLMGHRVAYRFGGKGGNQAISAARLGVKVAMAGCVGRDEAGGYLRTTLESAGVDHAQVSDCEAASGMSVAIIDENGDYAAVVVTGANARLEAAQISVPQGVKVLLLQNEVPEAVNLTLVRKAGEGTCVIVNAAPVRAMAEDLMAATHILVVNRIEAAQLTGMDAAGLDGEKAAKALCAQGPEATIVTMGSDGLALCDGRMTERIPAVAVDAISSHGAGDMFCGALAAEVARGASLRAACRFAAAAAALAVSRPVDAGRELTEAQVRRMVDQSVSIP